MALYEYICTSCSHSWEEMLPMQKRGIPTKSKCPECKKGKVEIKIGAKIGDPFALGVSGPSSSFKDIMRHAAKAHPRSKKLGKWS